MNSSTFRALAGIVAFALIAGCTSQIDSTPTPVITDESPNAGGIYIGTITPSGAASGTDVTAIFDSKEQFVIYSNDKTVLYAGLYSVGNSGISGQAQTYSLSSNADTGSASFNGSFDPKTSISAIYTFTLKGHPPGTVDESGLIQLPTYQALVYKQPSATKLLQGTWANRDNFGHYTTSFSISGDGGVSGNSTTDNCNYNGTISTINLQYNVYSVSLNEGCTITGGYATQTLTGLASIYPANTTPGSPKQLVMAVASPTGARLFTLTLVN